MKKSFKINIKQSILDDLRTRIANTRWTDEVENSRWEYGTNKIYLKELCDYWQNTFDWKKQEEYLNSFPHFKTIVDGAGLHYIHQKGEGKNSIPLLLTHGYPDSFVRFLKIIPLLTKADENGFSFDVIIPSIPGYGFSDIPTEAGMNKKRIAELFTDLITKDLGYKKFVAHGGDWGAGITEQIALYHPDSLLAIHLTDIPFEHGMIEPKDATPAEKKYFEATKKWSMTEGVFYQFVFFILKEIKLYMYISLKRNFILSMLIPLLFSCNNNNRKNFSSNLKDSIMENKTAEKQTLKAEEIVGPVGKISVLQLGEGGTPILFIHSFGGSMAHWKNQSQHLQTKTVAMDLRGHGNSETPANNDFAIESQVKDVEAVVNTLGLDKFILAGHSMGGSVAIAYAGKHPDKVAGLLLTGTPGKMPAEQTKPIITSLESDKYRMVMDDYMKKLLTNATPETKEMETEGMNQLNKEKSVSIIKESFAYDPLPAFKKYTGPKWIVDIAGMEEQPGSLHKAFPDVPYKTVAGTSHWIQLDKPYEFNKMVDDFLKEVEKKGKES